MYINQLQFAVEVVALTCLFSLVGGKDSTEFSKHSPLERQILMIIFAAKISRKVFLGLKKDSKSVIWDIQIQNCT